MMNFSKSLRWLTAALAVTCVTVAFSNGASAEKEFKGEHPIRVLKARYETDNARGGGMSAKGNITIWLQNATSVIVDGVDVEVELYNDTKRKVDTLKRSIEPLEAGEKRVLTFRWDVLAERDVTPRIFIEYNSRGNQKTRFEGKPPTWQ